MIIRDYLGKIKSRWAWIGEYEKELLVAGIILLSTGLAYNAGRLVTVEARKVPIRLMEAPIATTSTISTAKNALPSQNTNTRGQVVASKNGTKYHYLYCSGAKLIKAENKVFFASASVAEAAGFTLAGNCHPK